MPLRHLAVLVVLILLAAPSSSIAVDSSSSSGRCAELPLGADGVHRQSFDDVDVTDQIAATPPRVETELKRGEGGSYCIGFQNRTGRSISLDIDVRNLGSDEDGRPATGIDDAGFGAATWVHPSTARITDLEHGDMAWIDVDVDVPSDAVTGSSYASVVATARDSAGSVTEGDSQVNAVPSIAVQFFFDVAGNADFDGRIVESQSPRVIWWDGLDIGGLPVLDDLRGLGIGTIRFGWRNDGNLTDTVDGRILINSDLGGRSVATLNVPEVSVMRGAKRDLEATWSKDIPFIGRFTPTIEITDSTGTVHTQELDPIWVIPSWWYLLVVGLAIAIPLWIRRRNKRRYHELLERVEAAESRGHEDLEDEDSDWD
jgi:hypothetical protein